MALWTRLQTLDDEAKARLQEIYTKTTFPLEVRGTFAQWIEEQAWGSFDKSIPEHKVQAQCLVEELIKRLEEKSQSVNDLVSQMNYMRFKNLIKEMYLSNPWYLVESIKEILTAEQELVIKAEKGLEGVDTEEAFLSVSEEFRVWVRVR